MYKGYQYKLLDYYEVAAFVASRIMSAMGGKKVKERRLFDRRKAEKQLFRKERSASELRERYELAKKISMERGAARNGNGGKG